MIIEWLETHDVAALSRANKWMNKMARRELIKRKVFFFGEPPNDTIEDLLPYIRAVEVVDLRTLRALIAHRMRITEVHFSKPFDEPVTAKDLPLDLEKVVFWNRFAERVELPDGLRSATFGIGFARRDVLFPAGLTDLAIPGFRDTGAIVALPDSVRALTIGSAFFNVVHFPRALETLDLRGDFAEHDVVIPRGVRSVRLVGAFGGLIVLPDTVTAVECVGLFSRVPELPASVVDLVLDAKFTSRTERLTIPGTVLRVDIRTLEHTLGIVFNEGTLFIRVDSKFYRHLYIPRSAIELEVSNDVSASITIPKENSLRVLRLPRRMELTINALRRSPGNIFRDDTKIIFYD